MLDQCSWLTVQQLQDAGVLLVEDGNHGENRPRPDEFSTSGVCFIRAADMDGGQILFSSASRITDVALQRIRKGIGRPGDILLSHKGTVGKLAVAPLDCEPFICSPQTTFWRVLDHTRFDRRFLYFFMNSRAFRSQLAAIKGETDMADYASLTAQRRFKVPVLALALQSSIASILGSLDDKIELNRRMNATLEAMAQAIFRDWFVDFGPTRRKLAAAGAAAGRKRAADPVEIMGGLVTDPARASALAALFPAALGDNGLPEGWGSRSLAECATVLSGGTPSKGHAGYWSGELPWISPKVMTSIHIDDADDKVSDEAVHAGAKLAPIGTTLVMVRGMGLHDGMRVSQARRTVTFNQDVKAFIPKGIPEDFLFFGILALAPSIHQHVEASGHGTGKLPSDLLLGATLTVPEASAIGPLTDLLSSLNQQIDCNRRQNKTLAATRDLLLPKLMSGEIRLARAEGIVEAAT